MKFLREYWFLISFVVAPLLTGLVFLFSLSGRIHDSPKHKMEIDNHVKYSLTPTQQLTKFFMDSLDKDSAIRTRAKRLINQNKKDSISAIKDSIVLDIIMRNADQFFQMKLSIDSIKSHH